MRGERGREKDRKIEITLSRYDAEGFIIHSTELDQY